MLCSCNLLLPYGAVVCMAKMCKAECVNVGGPLCCCLGQLWHDGRLLLRSDCVLSSSCVDSNKAWYQYVALQMICKTHGTSCSWFAAFVQNPCPCTSWHWLTMLVKQTRCVAVQLATLHRYSSKLHHTRTGVASRCTGTSKLNKGQRIIGKPQQNLSCSCVIL